jgi:hypothetical protein
VNPPLRKRLAIALAAYAILAGIATVYLDGFLRTALWILFAGLTLRTISAAHKMDEED